MKKNNIFALALIISAVILATVSRIFPHLPNFAPLTALAIFSGAYLSKKQAAGMVFAARFMSDLFLGFFSWPLMVAVYLSHLAGVLLGIWIRHTNQDFSKWVRILSSSLVASTIFFFVTNFAFLYPGYRHDFSGILLSYVNGLPFFRATLMGDMFYTVGIFGSYQLVVAVKSYLARGARVQI